MSAPGGERTRLWRYSATQNLHAAMTRVRFPRMWHASTGKRVAGLEPGSVGAGTDVGEGVVVNDPAVFPDRHHRIIEAQRLLHLG